MDTRHALLEQAVRIFAASGWRGTTTRRVAEAAGVNEVTLFRHFGSKEALLQAAVAWVAVRDPVPQLPEAPGDLRAELLAWGLGMHAHAVRNAQVIRASMAEFEEHPELVPVSCEGAMHALGDVVRYLERARVAGLIDDEGSLEAATVMLMNAIFMDGITRDILPACDQTPLPPEAAIGAFTDLLLRALGARVAS